MKGTSILCFRAQVPQVRIGIRGPQQRLPTRGLEEFFEVPNVRKTWDRPISVGRAWKASELRLKSFEDLHSLWYILLKERNLLLTQTLQYKKEPATRRLRLASQNRYNKVKVSMARVKTIINERRIVANYLKTVSSYKKKVSCLKYFVKDRKTQQVMYRNLISSLRRKPKWRRMKSEISIRKQRRRFRDFYYLTKFERAGIIKDLQEWKSQNQRTNIMEKIGTQILENKSDQTPASTTTETPNQSYDPYEVAMEMVKRFKEKRAQERNEREAQKSA